ncbi:hypothetical protein LMG32289_06079 [Cupriavidus pampae]|uniref:Uncharacterized protein n=1 Tax=Cupriavidus pampae TaxID=659251 RepID=A0ABM8XZ41_9BURK|nr:hypothetical protein LMG32289_06079 [Cupriavidus pampae]
MSHLVQTMAYAGATPWHGLGNRLQAFQPLDVWAEAAGMNWRIEETDVMFRTGAHELDAVKAFSEQKVLYRSDYAGAPLDGVAALSGRPALAGARVLS